ncbi:MAG: ADP-ribosylation factor-like protein, partial [Bacteroidia bacterium]
SNVVAVEDVKKTWNIEKHELFRLQKIKLSFINVGILATDLPGDPEFRDTWEKVLLEVKPHGIIFLLDNVADTSKIPSSGYDPKRLKEHKQAFEHLIQLLIKHKDVSKELRAMAIVVNKSDSFPRDLTYGKLIKETDISTYLNQYVELNKCKSTAAECSALHGSNVKEIMRWLVDEMT